MFPKFDKHAFSRLANTSADDMLIESAYKGDFDGVISALEKGADVNAENDEALTNASVEGWADIVKLLLEKGADVHTGQDDCLYWASVNGHKDVVEILLAAGANPGEVPIDRVKDEEIRHLLEENL